MTADDRAAGGAGAGQPGGQPGGPVGSLAEEAAKLLGALQDLTTTAGHEHASAAGAALSGVAAGLRDVDAHLAGAPECRYCPVCRVVAAVRGTSPEVRAQLATAGSALLSAAAALLATPVPDDRRHRSAPVQRIDLDETGDQGDQADQPGDRTGNQSSDMTGGGSGDEGSYESCDEGSAESGDESGAESSEEEQ